MGLIFTGNPTRRNRAAAAICATLLAAFAILSYSAVLQKSATYDEPFHDLGDWFKLRFHDFRMDYESPAISSYWAAIPNGRGALKFDPGNESFAKMPAQPYRGWSLATDTLYRTPGNDGAAFINRSRLFMLLFSIAAGIITTIWAWQLAGPVAAIIASTFFCLDPNLIGHASLVKNDMAMTLAMAGTFLALWRVGRALTVSSVLLLAVMITFAMNAKFSGVMLWPMVTVLLGMRVILPRAWRILGRDRVPYGTKSLAACAVLVFTAGFSWAGTWACYGFRYNPAPDPSVQLDTTSYRRELIIGRFLANYPAPPAVDANAPPDRLLKSLGDRVNAIELSDKRSKERIQSASLPDDVRIYLDNLASNVNAATSNARAALAAAGAIAATSPAGQADAHRGIQQAQAALDEAERSQQLIQYWLDHPEGEPDLILKLADFMLEHRLMPSAWTNGIMVQYARSRVHAAFLLGRVRMTGTWIYFPIAMLVKTPIESMLALFGAAGAGVWLLRMRRRQWRDWVWPLGCLVVPLVFYVVPAITSNLDIGLRYLFPVYPFLFILAAVLIDWALRNWPGKRLVQIACILGILLAVDSLLAWPNYIAYFNVAIPLHDRINILSDSNLDWGQDLPALAKWQKRHPGARLALAYFGTADPAFYRIDYQRLPPGPPSMGLLGTHVVAISATHLQGVYESGYTDYQQLDPTEILGGTIYLYDLRPFQEQRPRLPSPR